MLRPSPTASAGHFDGHTCAAVPRRALVQIRAVTFDFWNTLVREHPDSSKGRLARHVAALERLGVSRTSAQLEEAAARLRVRFDERWHANQVVTPEVGATELLAALDLEPEQTLHAEVAAVFRNGGDPSTLTVADGLTQALDGLRGAGVRVGIICDAGFAPGATLRSYLAHHGLLDRFDHWSFSDEVGVFKPDPRIFQHAAAGLGVEDPASLAHVGDLRRTDVGGALRSGWTAVRYRGFNDDSPTPGELDAPIVLDSYADLLAALGLR